MGQKFLESDSRAPGYYLENQTENQINTGNADNYFKMSLQGFLHKFSVNEFLERHKKRKIINKAHMF